jgi:hypothetical protein
MTSLLVALMALAFAQPTIEPASPGNKQEHPSNYVISTENAYRVVNAMVQKAPKEPRFAFAFWSQDKLKVGVRRLKIGAVSISATEHLRMQIQYKDGQVVRKGWAKELMGFRDIQSVAAVTVGPKAEEYLLVEWRAENPNCEYGFTLFKVASDSLDEVANNVYYCF